MSGVRPRVLGVLAAFAICATTVNGQKEDAELSAALAKAADYVAQYRIKVSGVTLDEMLLLAEIGGGQMLTPRRLAADLTLVNVAERLTSLRDTYAIDTKPTRDRQPRVINELKEPTAAGWRRVQDYVHEGMYLYLANVVLWYSDPILPLEFVEREHQPRMTYKLEGKKKIANVQVIGIGFKEREEQGKKYLLGTESNPHSAGRIWIDPTSGAVYQTELWIQSDADTVRGTVTYAMDATVGLPLPREAAHSFEARESTAGVNTRDTTNVRRQKFDANAKYTNPKYTPVDLTRMR